MLTKYIYKDTIVIDGEQHTVYAAPKSSLKADLPTAQNLYPSQKWYSDSYKYSGVINNAGGGFYAFSLFNQLPGMPEQSVEGFCGHYEIKFNPDTGEIYLRKFGDYESLTSFRNADGDWEAPVNSALCTYIRKICRHAWEGVYSRLCTHITVNKEGRIIRRSLNPVNLHTGEPYRNCYFFLSNDH